MQSKQKWFVFLLVLLITACVTENPIQSLEDTRQDPLRASQVEQPKGWDDDLALTIPKDLNPDPNILEINIEAKIKKMEIVPGTKTPVWTYNGSLPGPLIKAKVGDKVIIHFKNKLPEATSIHWHGIRVPNNMDGVPNVTQDSISPGEKFTYEFIVKDAGTFWYHPHINTAAQVGWGMYGPIVIEDPNDPEIFGDELVVILSDMSVRENGELVPADQGGDIANLLGREGEVLLVNGKVMPTLKVRKGKQQRWRVINAARARYYSIRHDDAVLTKLGGDNGLAEKSEALKEIKIVPSERADFVFTPSDEPGTLATLYWHAIDRGWGTAFNRPDVKMMHIETVNQPEVIAEKIPTNLRSIAPIDISKAKELLIDLTVSQPEGKPLEMGINGKPFWEVEPIQVKLGETQIWTVRNNTDFNHPFHLHGYYFQVLDENLVPEWKDTIDIPVKSEVRLAVHFDERPGTWMYHCHILDHAEVGMMGQLVVSP
ncbi:multicopper oxidase CueO [Aurantivibrio infirmus]